MKPHPLQLGARLAVSVPIPQYDRIEHLTREVEMNSIINKWRPMWILTFYLLHKRKHVLPV